LLQKIPSTGADTASVGTGEADDRERSGDAKNAPEFPGYAERDIRDHGYGFDQPLNEAMSCLSSSQLDFDQDGDEAALRFDVKGGRKTKDSHFAATDGIPEYIKAAGINGGSLLALAFKAAAKRTRP
jgi:hypothetical protein